MTMTFDEVLSQIQDLLHREQRVSYRGLKRRFALDDEYLEDLKEELIGAKRIATDEDGRFLVWTSKDSLAFSVQSPASEQVPGPKLAPSLAEGSKVQSQDKSEVTDPQPLIPDPQGEAEAYFLKAIEIAQKQQAKSLELRATTSLARLWQQQGKLHEAHSTLSAIYNWFTEGFDTTDLQEARALIESLNH
jgi:hypothetical protein